MTKELTLPALRPIGTIYNLESMVRMNFKVTGDYEVYNGSYHLRFNTDPHCLPENIGYTFIRGRKFSKQDVLRMYGGDSMVQDYIKYLERVASKTTYKPGSMRSLLNRNR